MMKNIAIVFLLIYSGACLADNFLLAEQQRQSGNHIEAIKYYQLAANNGDGTAFHWLATYYFDGVSVKQDTNRAINYFQIAAAMGIKGSMVYLANIYLQGVVTPRDCKQAERFIDQFSNASPSAPWQEAIERCFLQPSS